MPRDYFTIIPAVYLILEKDNKILLLRRYNTGYNDGLYSLPSGHVEDGEFPIDALIREAQEEIGIIIAKEHLLLLMPWIENNLLHLRVLMFILSHLNGHKLLQIVSHINVMISLGFRMTHSLIRLFLL